MSTCLTVENAQSHVTAFQPISEAARSWSDDNVTCVESSGQTLPNLLDLYGYTDQAGWARFVHKPQGNEQWNGTLITF